jgi:uncharacterized protein (DUF885 family)
MKATAALVLLLLPVLPVFQIEAPAAAQEPPPPPSAAEWLDALAAEQWQRMLDRSPGLRIREGLPVTTLPDLSHQAAVADAEHAQGVLERLAAIDPAVFHEAGDHERWLTYKILRWQARVTVEGLPFFWHGFQVTPYSSGFAVFTQVFGQAPLGTAEGRSLFIDLLGQLPAVAAQLRTNLETQQERGILLPRPEIPLVEAIYTPFTLAPESHPLRVAPERLAAVPPAEAEAFSARAAELLRDEVAPAFARLLALFDEEYRAAAPDEVGISRYPGGAEAYRYLIGAHVGLDLSPEEIHQRGLAEVERIEAEMAEIRTLVGAEGVPARELHQALRTDPRFLACSPDGVAERLMRPVEAIEPLVADWFAATPEAPYGVARLDPALEGGMTFGYYQWPLPSDPRGIYYFNGSSLDERPLVTAAALIYHELVPGHHFQIALQTENPALPAFRRNGFPTAFVEGWAEYASELASEMGLYGEPYDRYGRLAMDMFLSSRLVVDTGMNALGWSRERALGFLRDRVLESDTQLATETLRYAVDIPGQALAYKMGALTIRDLRRRAEEALGDAFDVRRFHHAVLGHGAMPLEVLEEHVEWWIEEERKRAGAPPATP